MCEIGKSQIAKKAKFAYFVKLSHKHCKTVFLAYLVYESLNLTQMLDCRAFSLTLGDILVLDRNERKKPLKALIYPRGNS